VRRFLSGNELVRRRLVVLERRRKVGAKKGERVRDRWEDIAGRGGRRE
jgi:hypothetical protein